VTQKTDPHTPRFRRSVAQGRGGGLQARPSRQASFLTYVPMSISFGRIVSIYLVPRLSSIYIPPPRFPSFSPWKTPRPRHFSSKTRFEGCFRRDRPRMLPVSVHIRFGMGSRVAERRKRGVWGVTVVDRDLNDGNEGGANHRDDLEQRKPGGVITDQLDERRKSREGGSLHFRWSGFDSRLSSTSLRNSLYLTTAFERGRSDYPLLTVFSFHYFGRNLLRTQWCVP